jgi:hypothetical protein
MGARSVGIPRLQHHTAQVRQRENETAREELERSLTLVAQTGSVGLEPHIREALAALARAEGDERQALRELQEAHRLFSQHGAARRADDAAAELAALSGSTR